MYIVDEAHMLTREAWNALLKVLEEPPAGVVFVFATTDPQKIAQAAAPVLSRVQRFDFRRIGPHAIVDRLKHVLAQEKLKAEDDALHLIARSADGGMRDALSLLDQVLSFGSGPVTASRVREVLGLIPDERYGELLRVIADHDAKGAFALVEGLLEAGASLEEFVTGAGEALRAVLLLSVGGAPEGLTESMIATLGSYAPRFSTGDVVRLLSMLADSEGQIRHSGNQRLVVEKTPLSAGPCSRGPCSWRGHSGPGRSGTPAAPPTRTRARVPVHRPRAPAARLRSRHHGSGRRRTRRPQQAAGDRGAQGADHRARPPAAGAVVEQSRIASPHHLADAAGRQCQGSQRLARWWCSDRGRASGRHRTQARLDHPAARTTLRGAVRIDLGRRGARRRWGTWRRPRRV